MVVPGMMDLPRRALFWELPAVYIPPCSSGRFPGRGETGPGRPGTSAMMPSESNERETSARPPVGARSMDVWAFEPAVVK